MLSAGAVISVFSVTLVTIYGQTRILYALSIDRLLPPLFQRFGRRAGGGARRQHGDRERGGRHRCRTGRLSGYLWDMVVWARWSRSSSSASCAAMRDARPRRCIVAKLSAPFGPLFVSPH